MKFIILLIALVLSSTLGQAQTPTDSLTTQNPNEIINPATDIITLAELFANKETYANKIIKVKGEVKKFNSKIMGKNWIHIQDGTEHLGENDLTVTSQMETKPGDIIIIEGKIILDKDFGSGYFYKIIMEEGKILE